MKLKPRKSLKEIFTFTVLLHVNNKNYEIKNSKKKIHLSAKNNTNQN